MKKRQSQALPPTKDRQQQFGSQGNLQNGGRRLRSNHQLLNQNEKALIVFFSLPFPSTCLWVSCIVISLAHLTVGYYSLFDFFRRSPLTTCARIRLYCELLRPDFLYEIRTTRMRASFFSRMQIRQLYSICEECAIVDFNTSPPSIPLICIFCKLTHTHFDTRLLRKTGKTLRIRHTCLLNAKYIHIFWLYLESFF